MFTGFYERCMYFLIEILGKLTQLGAAGRRAQGAP